MTRSVSFASALDPALRAVPRTRVQIESGPDQAGPSGQVLRRSVRTATRADAVAGSSWGSNRSKSRHATTTTTGPSTAKRVTNKQAPTTRAKLRMASPGHSPSAARRTSAHPGDLTIGDVTEPIQDDSVLLDDDDEQQLNFAGALDQLSSTRPWSRTISAPLTTVVTEPWPSLPRQISLTPSQHPLALSLAREAQEKQQEQRNRHRSLFQEADRLTSYGSKRRKLERRVSRSLRNGRAIPGPGADQPPSTPTVANLARDQENQVSDAIKTLISFEAPTFDLSKAVPASSQHSQLSVQSDDGVYRAQFSFYRFDEEEDQEMVVRDEEPRQRATLVLSSTEGDTVQGDRMDSLVSSYTSHHHGSNLATQAGYDGDQSASWHSMDAPTQLDRPATVAEASHPDVPTEQGCTHALLPPAISDDEDNDDDDVLVFHPMFASTQDPDDHSSNHQMGLKGLRALCTDQSLPEQGRARRVYPTIWRGGNQVRDYFGPMQNPFICRHLPPTRADLSRWADWMDSQSQDAAEQTATHGPDMELYNYRGTMDDIVPWSQL